MAVGFTEKFGPVERAIPIIYVYRNKNHKEYLKVGMTRRTWKERSKELRGVNKPFNDDELLYQEFALDDFGKSFEDHDVHRRLSDMGIERERDENGNTTEFFECSLEDVKKAIASAKTGIFNINRTETFKLRPEQERAIKKTKNYFTKIFDVESPDNHKFLWNAKMRFGKTFTSYMLAKEMGYKKILVVTYKPAVLNSWKEELESHVNFADWTFYNAKDEKFKMSLSTNVVFVSFQDLLGKDKDGDVKLKNRIIGDIEWDLVIFDEYHFGSWRKNAKDLFENRSEISKEDLDANEINDESVVKAIKSKKYLYLSGTPFRALSNGEFIEDQVFNWTYTDEQRAKYEWTDTNNPYLSLPKMIMMTYKMPKSISYGVTNDDFQVEFSLNTFFKTSGDGEEAKFVHERAVRKWLDLIRGNNVELEALMEQVKEKQPMPFSEPSLTDYLRHTFWYLPNVASCIAMKNLIKNNNNTFWNEFDVVVAAGTKAGIGNKALIPVKRAIKSAEKTGRKTITLSCGKLTTGVTIKEWSGVFVLRDLSSPESYFQTIFRVQSPWTFLDIEKQEKVILKDKCYVFDFSLNRTLRLVQEYGSKINGNDLKHNHRDAIDELIRYLPILASDGGRMMEIDTDQVIDIAMNGQSATLLAKRWNSPMLVNVDNHTLTKLLGNKEILLIIEKVEGFRNISKDIATVITKSERVSKLKDKGNPTKKDKAEISKERKEMNSLRKKIQEKLIKFATRIPVFMYLTDYREQSLSDVITKLEPGLFQKVTGLNIEDFEQLVSLNVFNKEAMNDAIYKFKRYEDTSFDYLVETPKSERIGLFDTTVKRSVFETK